MSSFEGLTLLFSAVGPTRQWEWSIKTPWNSHLTWGEKYNDRIDQHWQLGAFTLTQPCDVDAVVHFSFIWMYCSERCYWTYCLFWLFVPLIWSTSSASYRLLCNICNLFTWFLNVRHWCNWREQAREGNVYSPQFNIHDYVPFICWWKVWSQFHLSEMLPQHPAFFVLSFIKTVATRTFYCLSQNVQNFMAKVKGYWTSTYMQKGRNTLGFFCELWVLTHLFLVWNEIETRHQICANGFYM